MLNLVAMQETKLIKNDKNVLSWMASRATGFQHSPTNVAEDSL